MKIGVSGHRPTKLGGYSWDAEFNRRIREYYKVILRSVLDNGSVDSIQLLSGMALGFDQYMAQVVIDLRNDYKGRLELWAIVPSLCQDNFWRKEDVKRYSEQLEVADKLIIVDTLKEYSIPGVTEGEYDVRKLEKRNRYIADKMDKGLVLFDGTKGGTCNFVRYAENIGKELIIQDPRRL